MTQAPERIWAWPEPDDGLGDQVDDWGWVYGDWDRSQLEDGLGVQYVRADLSAATLARAERAEAELAKLADPNAVHVSMLAGSVAKPSWRQIKHIYAEEAERAEALLAEAVEALRFYADERLDGYDVHVTDYGLSTEEGHIIEDGGERARATLARIQEAKNG